MKNTKAHLALLVVNIIYGANYVIAKEAMPAYIQPFGFVCIRVTGAFLLFFLLHSFLIKESVDKADIPKLILCGFFGVIFNQLLFFKGLSLTSPINASLIMITTPIIVMIISSILIKEKITKNKAAGIALGAIGVSIIHLVGGDQKIEGNLLGDIMVLLNAICYGSYLVMVKPLMNKYNPFTVLKWVFGTGLLVWFVGFSEFNAIDWASFLPHIWLVVAYVVIGTTFFAYLLNTYALKRVNPSLVGIYIYSQPIIAALIAISLGKEGFSSIKIMSAALIFTGVYLVSKNND